MPDPDKKPTCFIAMPITTHEHEIERYNGDAAHWHHVMETIFVKAIEAAGFEAIRPVTSGSHMIHGQIIRHLSTADLVLCDLSAHNPNVFFELGVRTSLNLPIALVRDEHTDLPFDTSGINTHTYSSTLHGWEIEAQIADLTKHLHACVESSAGANPLWKHFGLTITAAEPASQTTSSDAKIELIWEGMNDLRKQLEGERADRKRRLVVESANDSNLPRHIEFGMWIAAVLGITSHTAESLPERQYDLQFALGNLKISQRQRDRIEQEAMNRGFEILGERLTSSGSWTLRVVDHL